MEPIKSVKEFLDNIETGEQVIYRGQAKESWSIIPSVGRRATHPIESGASKSPEWVEEAKGIERQALNEFKKRCARMVSSQNFSDLDWLTLMQHHGAPTRLIDFTKNPLVALYFASHGGDISENGVVIQGKYNIKHDDYTDDIFNISQTFTYFPKHLSDRIVGQSGCFLVSATPNRPIVSTKLVKHKIDRFQKHQILIELDHIGINASSLFPGMDGNCMHIGDSIYRGLTKHYLTFL